MKKKLILKILLLILLSFEGYSQNQKKALIIAIGTYNSESRWTKLASLNDLRMIKTTLIRQGFLAKNIDTLTDENATKKNIIAKIEKLIDYTKPDDKIVIHFSGHGQQVKDINGDEKKILKNGKLDYNDIKDEAIVPYDALPEKANGEAEKLIIDDQIGLWMDRLKAKVGSEGQILLCLDCCHSGDASRGRDVVRGGRKPIGINDAENNFPDESGSGYFDFETNQSSSKNIGAFIMFCAAASGQKNYQTTTPEGLAIGSLTYAISKAFEQIKIGETFESLFQKVYKVMLDKMNDKSTSQSPTKEGDLGNLVFGGKINVQEPYYSISRIKENGERLLKISQGYFSNLFEGTEMSLFLVGSKNSTTASPIAKGRIIESDAFESKLLIDDKLSNNETSFWGFVTKYSFGNYKVVVDFGEFQDKALRMKLEDTLKFKKIVLISGRNNDFIITQKEKIIELILSSTGRVYAKITNDENVKRNIVNKIIDFGRAKIISSLEIKSQDYQADISLTHIGKERLINTNYIFNTNEKGLFSIHNAGNNSFYFTLLEILPNGDINVLLPNIAKGFNLNNVKLEIGQKKVFTINRFSYPVGIRKYKVIMSSNPEHFTFLNFISYNNIRAVENNNSLESLFKDLSDGSMERATNRGENTIAVPTIGGTATLTYEVIDN